MIPLNPDMVDARAWKALWPRFLIRYYAHTHTEYIWIANGVVVAARAS